MDEQVREAAIEVLKESIRYRDQPAYRPPDHAVLECLTMLVLDLLGESVQKKKGKKK